MRAPLRIAPLTTVAEYAECERLQQLIWETDAVDVVPRHLLMTFQRHGGMVLGAFDATGQMVGFAFGFLGQAAPGNAAAGGQAWQHCSHELGVVRQIVSTDALKLWIAKMNLAHADRVES